MGNENQYVVLLIWLDEYIQEYQEDIDITLHNIYLLNDSLNENPDNQKSKELLKDQKQNYRSYKTNRNLLFKMKYMLIEKLLEERVLHVQKTNISDIQGNREYLMTEYRSILGTTIYQLKTNYDEKCYRTSLYIEEKIEKKQLINQGRPNLRDIQIEFRKYMNMTKRQFQLLKYEYRPFYEEGFNYKEVI